MKLTVILLLSAGLQVSANGLAQKITYSAKSVPIEKVLSAIRDQTGYVFFYAEDDLKGVNPVTVEFRRATVESAMAAIQKTVPINFEIQGRTVFITKRLSFRNTENAPLLVESIALLTVRGRVVNEKGEPVIASITVKGTSIGTTSDANGNFELRNIDDNAVLVITSVNMDPIEVRVNGRTEINVTLQTRSSELSEVVISYGTQTRREVTGAVSTLGASQLEDQPVGQIAQKIQGRIPGVQINQGSGTPGAGMHVRIRGSASLNAGNVPLYVVDGLPITGDLSTINPNEIETFSVLKGPSAAALYGSRASSGVVLITTKKGRNGRTSIEFNGSQGISTVPKRGRLDLMNGEEFATFLKERYEDMALYEGYTGGVPAEYQDPSIYRGKNTDWYEVLLRDKANVSNYNLTLSVGKDNFSSATTFGYYNEEGSIIDTWYKRFSIRSNNEFRVNDNIRAGLNVAPSFRSAQNMAGGGGQGTGSGLSAGPLGPPGIFVSDGSYSVLFAALTTAPWFDPFERDANGQLPVRFSSPGLFTEPNWYRTVTEIEDVTKTTSILSNAYAEFDFLKHFRFRTSVSLELNHASRKEFKPSTAGWIFAAPPSLATGAYTTNNSYSWQTENTLEYRNDFGDHSLDVLVGYTAQKYRSEYNRLTGQNFPDDAVSWVGAAGLKNGENSVNEWAILSMLGRVNYNYKGKYLLSLSMRRDGSSRFGLNDQWGNFPAVSAGWVISDENFASDWNAISFLKLRGEVGRVGNYNIGNYTQYANLGPANYVFGSSVVQGRAPTSIANATLSWEESAGVGVGIDMGLFNNRIFFTFDYYRNNTTNMLYQTDIPNGTGFSNVQDNVGKFKLWGYEFGISSQNTVAGDFKWRTDLNLSINRNKVIQLGTNNTPFDGVSVLGGTGYWITKVGEPIGQFYGWVFDGIYMTQEEFNSQPHHPTMSDVGTVRYKDINGDKTINENDRTIIGNPNPKFTFGVNNSFTYKNFDANIVISGAYDVDMYFSQREWSESLSGIFNLQRIVKDRWRSEANPGKGIIQRTLNGKDAFPRYNNSRWIEDASFLTVKNITVGYTIPKITKYIQRARVYATVQQALVITGYTGANPEASLNGNNGTRQGLDTNSFPVPRTFSLGLNLNL